MNTFDLDQAIATWRRNLRLNRAFLGEDLDELEAHLRDHVERLKGEGLEPRAAFYQALRRLGTYGELEGEYQKVRMGRTKRHRSVRRDSAWTAAMLRNHLTIAFRNLRRHSFYAGLNVTGLAIGVASCLLILLYIADESQYDRFHERADEIYRLNWDFSWNNRQGMGSGTPPPLAANLVREIPGIQETTRVYPAADMVVRYEDRFFTETSIFGVDTTFFAFFSFPLLEGDPETALALPGSVILTEAMARKYFGDEPALGKAIQIGEDGGFQGRPYSSAFRVTGIVQDPPEQSHFHFDMLTSMASHPHVAYFDWSWIWMQVVTYAIVSDPSTIPDMESRIVDMVAQYAPPAFNRVGFSYDELIGAGGYWNFVFQPMTDIHLGSARIGNRLGPVGSRTNLYIFGVVALFIMVIACINAMNLSTARSSTRASEVGVRKVLGSARAGLMGQFMVESFLFSALATLFAVGLAALAMGPFNAIAGKSLALSLTEPAWLPFALLGMILLVGILAGSYPSFYLSAFRPIEVLKGTMVSGKGGRALRNGLVVMQFAISIALIVCTLLVRSQMVFFRQADMGFDKENVLIVSNQNDRLGGQEETFRQMLEGRAEVASAALSTGLPTTFWFQDYYKAEGKGDEQYELSSYMVDDHFIETLGLEIIRGHGFSPDIPSGKWGVVLNETAVQQLGWQDPMGKTITYPSVGDFTVIGIVKDFNFVSLQDPILPFALFHRASESYSIPNSSVVVRLEPGNLHETVAMVESAWASIAPDAPFEYAFLDETIQTRYRAEQRLEMLFLIFAGLAIVVACLGLWGLAAFVAEKRTKEIGIRKSLGASVPGVLALLIRDFTRWVVLANLIAWPLAWFWAKDWLEEFAFRIEIGLTPFVIAALAALVIAVLTVAYQAARTARANPVEALRYE